MIEEIQKRPLARPLFLWILGILFQLCFPLQQFSFVLLLLVILFVFISFMCHLPKNFPSYHTRWIWGVLFSCLLVFVSIQVTAIAEQRLYSPKQENLLQIKAQKVQIQMIEKLDRLELSDAEKAVLAAITVNYKRSMSREIRKRFSATGLAHLLSVSGFHVGVVAGFLTYIFTFFPRRSFFKWFKFILMFLLIWVFAYIAGLTAPAVRAALMFSVFIAGQALNLRPDRYNTLAAAAFGMLIYNPFYLFEIGFQLSFMAVFFILYLQPRLFWLIELRNPIIILPWSVLTVSIAAQVGTFFLCCFYFGEFSTVFLFTNLFLSVIATLLIPMTLLWMVLPENIPGLETLQFGIETLMKCFMWMVNRFSQVPGATIAIRFDFITMLVSYLILGLVIFYFRSRKKRILFASLFLLLFIICFQFLYF